VVFRQAVEGGNILRTPDIQSCKNSVHSVRSVQTPVFPGVTRARWTLTSRPRPLQPSRSRQTPRFRRTAVATNSAADAARKVEKHRSQRPLASKMLPCGGRTGRCGRWNAGSLTRHQPNLQPKEDRHDDVILDGLINSTFIPREPT
jgi:hypothetical protein